MVIVSIDEAEGRFSWILAQVAAGRRVTITDAGQPIADVVPHRCDHVIFGGSEGKIRYDDETFDDPDSEVAALFGISEEDDTSRS